MLANIEIENTEARAPPLFFIRLHVSRPRVEVGASTLHSLLDLGANYESELDFAKRHEKVVALLRMAILLLDEVSTCRGHGGRVGLDLICRWLSNAGGHEFPVDDRLRHFRINREATRHCRQHSQRDH